MNETPSSSDPKQSDRRFITAVSFIVICAAISGYFIGIASPHSEVNEPAWAPASREHEPAAPESAASEVMPATAYADIPQQRFGPNRDWTTQIAALQQEPYDLWAKILIDPAQKAASLTARAELRAYNGAPPTIPHPIAQMSTESCVACHTVGVRAQGLRVAKTPHPYYANCTQCHVEQQATFAKATMNVESSFVGLPAPSAGDRANFAAPPVVPHSTWMRNDCLSCHGRTASPGMETTHPWRQNCLQCHASSARLEQRRLDSAPQFLPPLPIEENTDGN